MRWQGQTGLGQDSSLSQWIEGLDQRFKTRLDEIAGLIGHGLDSPEEFRLAYWRKRLVDPGLESLWQDAERARILTQDMIGRAAEVKAFVAVPQGTHTVGNFLERLARRRKVSAYA